MAGLDWARRAISAGAAAGAMLSPLVAEAGRRGRGDGDHAGRGVRDYWERAGNGGTASASADGGSFTFGDIRSSNGTATESNRSSGDSGAGAERHNGNRNNNNDNNNNNNDSGNDNGNDGNPVGGRAGDAASRLRDYADKLTGADRNNARGGNNDGGAGDTDTNITYDPTTGAFGYDNGNVAYIRDADGSSFYQTGNITFEVGSGASLDGGAGGDAGGGGRPPGPRPNPGDGGGNNNGGGGFNS